MKKIKILTIIILAISLILLSINFFVAYKTKNNIYYLDNLNDSYDYALILGCKILDKDTPSLMLKDRLDKGIELYNNKKVNKIIISGDNSVNYSEVDVMYKYLINNGIDDNNIIRDDIGYSTGESITNYYNNYKDKRVVIVTQKYHLYRALYISSKYNLNTVGVPTNDIKYYGQLYRDIREILARIKDFFKYR